MRLDVRMKLLATTSVLMLGSLIITAVAITSLSSVNDQSARSFSVGTTAVRALGTVDADLAERQGALDESIYVGGVAATQSQIDATIAADNKEIAAALATYEALPHTAQEISDLASFNAAEAKYGAVFDTAREEARLGSSPIAAAADAATAATILGQMVASLDKLEAAANADAAALNAQTGATFNQGRLLAILVFLLVAGSGLCVSLLVAGSIRKGIRSVQETLTSMTDNCASALEAGLAALSRNDLSVEVHSVTEPIETYGSDEIGQTAVVTNRMLARLRATIESYEAARAGLADTVGQVKTAAEGLSRASSQLNSTATQSGTASQQVAQTIGQVAVGASDQARAASRRAPPAAT